MYNSEQKTLASTIFNIVGGRKMQLYVKRHPDIIVLLNNATDFLPITSNSIERCYCILNDITHQLTCKSCDNIVKWDKSNRQYKKHCSRKCSSADNDRKTKVKNTVQRRYGVDNPSQSEEIKQKKINTCVKNHKVQYPQQNQDVRTKTFETMQENYGVNYPYQDKQLNDKKNNTLFNNYGVHNPSQSDEIQQKKIKTNYKKYGEKHYNTSLISHALEFLENKQWLYHQHYVLQKSITHISSELTVNGSTVLNYLHSHGLEAQHFFQSTGEKQLSEYITSLDINIISNTRKVIPPYELDIYIPEHNLAIEYCGLYWHSEQQGKDKNYHKKKHDLCKKKGIQLLTIFEDEWQQRQEQVKNKILSSLNRTNRQKVFARKTNIVEVSTKQKQEFFDDNHIQGNGPGSINIGLEYEGTLIACMSFIKQKEQHYLNRYATSCSIPGGFSKLLKYVQTNYEWQHLISFADLRWSNGDLYEKTGWTLDSILPPDYFYSPNSSTRIHKFNYRRKNLPTLLNNFNPDLSERENCDNNGILRIWDCGKLRYVINNN